MLLDHEIEHGIERSLRGKILTPTAKVIENSLFLFQFVVFIGLMLVPTS